jgi:EAL domain-containing protein (putative c-di-GMP-specific phosphodiesterase class I)/GGDEF domain-containing protein
MDKILNEGWWGMANSKDKRIKKFKKKHVWPSVLGLFILLIVCGLLFFLVVEQGSEDMIKRKIATGINETEPIAKLFGDYDDNNKEEIHNNVLTYINMVPNTHAVWISDGNGNPIWSSSDKSPNLSDIEEIYYGDEVVLNIIVESDNDEIVTVREHNILINHRIFKKIDFNTIINLGLYDSDVISELKMWYVHEINGLKVYVLRDIFIYYHDFWMPFIFIVAVAIMIAVFIIYDILSSLSVFLNMRNTNKVLYTDVTTGGRNWLYFEKKGNKLLKKKSPTSDYAVIHFKMRKYRSFCTCFGVREGEVLIEKLHSIMKKNIDYKELMVHKENATFGMLLSYRNEEELCKRIEALTESLNSIFVSMKLYFAVGVYKVHRKETDIEQLYNNAVLACDMLSEEAKTQIVFYDVEMNKRRLWERKVEDDMYSALTNHEFKVYLQPKISTGEECLAGAEALVRWIHPTEGFIPPNKFIPIFEKNGFILQLDDYMLEEIAKQQAAWIAQGRKVVPISVNVSRAHFTREDLAEHICGIVDKYQVPHNVIELELTESAFFDDKEVLLGTVKKLRESGFIVSMDDFGAGYSSLNSLKELQLDVLKIDADFFRGVDSEDRGMLIVSEVIDLAKKLNMKIVAEGIESREQVDFLAEQECDLIQGYFFAKPMPINEFEEKYKENKSGAEPQTESTEEVVAEPEAEATEEAEKEQI